MSLSLDNLQAAKKKTRRRVGRGNSSGAGTYSGRGMKGQRSRSGGKGGLKIKGMRQRLLSIPKLRGFKSQQKKVAVVNIGQLEEAFPDKAVIRPKFLTRKGLIVSPRYGVKILGEGKVSKAFTIQKCSVSKQAKEKIEAAGGTIQQIEK